jgi:hypothetical protein
MKFGVIFDEIWGYLGFFYSLFGVISVGISCNSNNDVFEEMVG